MLRNRFTYMQTSFSKFNKFSLFLSYTKICGVHEGGTIEPQMFNVYILTLSLLMSYIYGAPLKSGILTSYIYIYIHTYIYIYVCVCVYLRLATLKAAFLYLLHNVSTLNKYRKFSCFTIVCKHFASYQD
jgi:hypothetical protein